MYSTIELFAGAGGLALGVEKAGFNTIGLIEFDKDACETLKTNRPNWNVICDDIANISCLDLEEYFQIKKGELDLLSGGAPCQAFSYAGKRLGLEDARGTLFYHYAIFLQKLQPKVFLFENVRGLLTHDHGKTYQTMLNIFESAGYDIQKKVLNAWDYGVAQKRERLITIGIRRDLKKKIKFVFPEPHEYKPVLRDILKDVPESIGVPYGENKRKLFELVPPGGYWRDIDPKLAKEYMKSCWDMGGGRTGILRRLSLDEPSLTVLTSPSQKQTERCPYCSSQRPIVGETDFLTRHPDLAHEWDYEKNEGRRPEDFTGTSGQMIYWICPNNHSYCASIAHRVYGTGCPKCSESRLEKYTEKWLTKSSVDYKAQVRFNELKGVGNHPLSYDFGIKIKGRYKYLIECQGVQHYEPFEYFGGEEQFEKQKLHDELKREYAIEKGITLIEIPYTCDTYEKVEEILSMKIEACTREEIN